MTRSDDRSPVGSVDKALVLLELLAETGPEGLALGELADAAGLNKTSVHRILRALAHRGFAARDATGGAYRLGPAAVTLGLRFHADENLAALMHPVLAALSERTDELVHLGTLEGTQVLYLDKIDPERTLRVWSRVGHRAPSARTGLGRALLLAQGVRDEDLDLYVRAARQQADVPDAAGPEVTTARLATVITQARECGWAEEIEENEAGISCVAAALTRPVGPPIAVSITGPAERMTAPRRADIGRMLREELGRRAPAGFTLTPAEPRPPLAAAAAGPDHRPRSVTP